jgi:hypothetical protein
MISSYIRDVELNSKPLIHMLQVATPTQATEADARDTVCAQVTWTQHSYLLHWFQDPLSVVHALTP